MTDITVHFDSRIGPLKRLHGVNNGPEGYGALVDVSHYYKQAQFPLVRLHDPNWPHAWEVDIHTIFPDFAKDPADPDSYDFTRSDTYIGKILATGAQILFRLGESIEHTPHKYYVHPPADFERWAQICVGIIRHYNFGWADGFHYNIAYWEVWNEPDVSNARMWSGTMEQYFELYRVTARAIKQLDPALKVGGPAAAAADSELAQAFLQMCRDRQLPLDFFSWHVYTIDPERIRQMASYVRHQLDAFGFAATESVFDEWNYMDSSLWSVIFEPGSEYMRKEMFERSKGVEGASFAAAVLTMLQECPVDQANYYDAQPHALFCGLFDYYGVPQKAYYAFDAFNRLAQFPHRVEAAPCEGAQGLYCCAAVNDDGEAAVLISNYGTGTRMYELALNGLATGLRGELYVLDRERNLQPEPLPPIASGRMSLLIPQHAVMLLKFVAV
ncbi:GH39 family glycosyl hydrolase [Paenibacillus cymbidii]|uniref:GH39 family glycosyl hydrolase n=1 Tax=Paenibacillus cymbidii TaxID=1639034 RepID=UPI0014368303|nr:hypothetical protein [Paenibacillus cymbidii]